MKIWKFEHLKVSNNCIFKHFENTMTFVNFENFEFWNLKNICLENDTKKKIKLWISKKLVILKI